MALGYMCQTNWSYTLARVPQSCQLRIQGLVFRLNHMPTIELTAELNWKRKDLKYLKYNLKQVEAKILIYCTTIWS